VLLAHGFTLIEIMVTVVIISLLATLVSIKVFDSWERSKRSKAVTDISAFKHALQLYKLDHGQYPTTAEGLAKLLEPPPGGEEGYVEHVREDPWGVTYEYASDGRRFVVRSFARDGREGGTGYDEDISSDAV
jgi:general secretion pathway protein G